MEYIESGIKKLFALNQKLNVRRNEPEETVYYASYVKDLDEDYVFIEKPRKGGLSAVLLPNEEIELAIICDDGILSGYSTVVSVSREQISGIWVTYPDFLQKIQRREFIREAISIPVKLSQIREDGSEQEIEAESANLSGSGIAILTRVKLTEHGKFKIKFEFKDILIETMVKYVHTQYDLVKKKYLTGLQFMDIDRNTSAKIHKGIIDYQIELRKKDLI